MPQGDSSAAGAPAKEQYVRKKESRRSGAQGVGGRAAQINPNFGRALPSMVRDIEDAAAGKLLRSGASMKLDDLKRAGVDENKAIAKKRKRVNPVSALLARGRNIKGLRGEFSAEELAELDPDLKRLMAERERTGGAKRAARAGGGGGGGGGGEGALPARAGGGGGGGGGAASGGRGRVQALSGAAGALSAEAGGVFASDPEVAATFGKDFL
jgi:hypothetical protein